ncbi:hypothetical protein EON71_00355 [bacterium]|nr:MAG: hypothetical protein EON71_00355 [bacterium]
MDNTQYYDEEDDEEINDDITSYVASVPVGNVEKEISDVTEEEINATHESLGKAKSKKKVILSDWFYNNVPDDFANWVTGHPAIKEAMIQIKPFMISARPVKLKKLKKNLQKNGILLLNISKEDVSVKCNKKWIMQFLLDNRLYINIYCSLGDLEMDPSFSKLIDELSDETNDTNYINSLDNATDLHNAISLSRIQDIEIFNKNHKMIEIDAVENKLDNEDLEALKNDIYLHNQSAYIDTYTITQPEPFS